MRPVAEADGVDFRPFFDMVVGILFVLLILIGALIFFQRTADSEQAAVEAERNTKAWHAQVSLFLERLAHDLQERGFEPKVDLPNQALDVPLAALAGVAADGLPAVWAEPARAFGGVVASGLGCLVAARQPSESCAPYNLLHLNLASIRVQTGGLAPEAALPQDKFGRLLTSELSTTLLRMTPVLQLTNDAGAPAFDVAGGLSASLPVPGASIGGNIELKLDLLPP